MYCGNQPSVRFAPQEGMGEVGNKLSLNGIFKTTYPCLLGCHPTTYYQYLSFSHMSLIRKCLKYPQSKIRGGESFGKAKQHLSFSFVVIRQRRHWPNTLYFRWWSSLRCTKFHGPWLFGILITVCTAAPTALLLSSSSKLAPEKPCVLIHTLLFLIECTANLTKIVYSKKFQCCLYFTP